MRLYKRIDLRNKSNEGQLVQFIGIYILRLGRTDEATDGFVEATNEEIAQVAAEITNEPTG